MKFTTYLALVSITISSTCSISWGQPAAPAAPRATRTAVFTRGSSSFLGVGVVEIDSDRAKALNLKEERGVEVKNVDSESPAAKAGIKEGDVILEYNGQRVEGLTQIVRMISETPAGHKVNLLISRNGATQTVTATIAARANHGFVIANGADTVEMPAMPAMPAFSMPDIPGGIMSWQSSSIGIESESLNSQLAEFFGVKEGVLVRSVNQHSPAEKAGLRAGDVIVKVEGNVVKSPREITGIVRTSRGKKNLMFHVVRNKKEMTIEITPGSEWSADRLAGRHVM